MDKGSPVAQLQRSSCIGMPVLRSDSKGAAKLVTLYTRDGLEPIFADVSATAVTTPVRNLAPLAALLPRTGQPSLGPNEILDRFVSFVSAAGLTLYPAQEE